MSWATKTGVSLGDKDEHHGWPPPPAPPHCAGQTTSSEHEGTALMSTDRKTLSTELALWDIRCYSSGGKMKRGGTQETNKKNSNQFICNGRRKS